MKTKTANPGSTLDPGPALSPSEFFRMMVDRMPIGAIVTDRSGKVIFANQSLSSMSGFSIAELAGRNISGLLNPSEKSLFRKLFSGSGHRGEDHMTSSIVTKDGDNLPVAISWTPCESDPGDTEGYCFYLKDITSERKLESECKENRDNYRMLVENHGEGIGIVDKNEYFVMVNPAAEEIFGMSPGTLATRNLLDFIVPDQKNRILEETNKRAQLTKSTYEVDIITPSGEIKNLLVTATPQVDSGGNMTGTLGVFRDNTRLKRIQETLRQGEHRYRTLFESAQDGILLVEGNRFVDCNASILRMFGCRKEDIIGKTPDVLSPEKQPGGEDSLTLSRYKLLQALKGDSHPFEWRHCQLDGTEFDAEILLSRIEVESKPLILAFVRNITERKQAVEELRHSEQKYRDMANLLPTAIFETDLNGNLVYANQTGLDWFGFKEEEIKAGIPVLQFIAPQNRQRAADTIQKIISQNKVASGEYTAVKKNGDLMDVYITSSAVHRDGKPVGIRGNISDITKLKKVEETAMKLASIVESSDDAIYAKTLEGIISSWNKGAEIMFGHKAEEIIGCPASVLIEEQNRAEEKLLLEKIRNGEHIKHFETTRKRKDGSDFEVSLTISPILNLSGEIIGAASIVRDITERRNAEKFRLAKETTEALLKSEEKFSKAFHNSPVPICITTLFDPRFIEVNQSFEEQIGFTNTDLKDRFLSELSSNTERHNVSEIQESLTLKGFVRNQEMSIRIKNRENHTFLLSAEIFEIGGEPCVLTVLADITERRLAEQTIAESQQRFQLMIEQTLVGFIECDTNFRVTSWNPSAERIFGFSAKEVIGRHIGNLIVKEGDQDERNKLWTEILVSKDGISTTNENKTKEGRTITCEWHDTAIVNRDGTVMGIVSLVADITERMEIENSLRQSREQLQHFAQHLQTIREEERVFISRELHDSLGQSLTGLKMYACNIYNKLNKEVSGNNLINLREQSKEVVGIIDNIMQQVRKIAKDLRPRILDEFGLIPAIEAHVQEITKQTGIKHEIVSMIRSIEMDPAYSIEIFRIIQEACTNIIRHSGATLITIRINSRKNNYIIEVEDNGCGIKETDISRLKSLGLLGMKERSQVFGGELEITGIEGKGTKVSLTFPKKLQVS